MERSNGRWRPPLENVYKINSNATFSLASNTMGIGIVVCDLEGMFMAGKEVQLLGCPNLHRAELLATKEALLFAWEARFTRVF